MAGPIETFFFAWGAPDERRDAILAEALAEGAVYEDPRGRAQGVPAITDYVAQFLATAPGGAAEVVETSEGADGATEVRVRFHGSGFEHFGRYEAQLDGDGRILRMSGVRDG